VKHDEILMAERDKLQKQLKSARHDILLLQNQILANETVVQQASPPGSSKKTGKPTEEEEEDNAAGTTRQGLGAHSGHSDEHNFCQEGFCLSCHTGCDVSKQCECCAEAKAKLQAGNS